MKEIERMQFTFRQRRLAFAGVLAMFIVAQFVGLFAKPQPVVAAPSANPGDEIVYLDPNGFIKILDPDGGPLNGWSSPDGEWEYLSLGDVNADSDIEILAIGRAGGSVKVKVFDPVLARGGASDKGGKYNDVPWDILWEQPLFEGVSKFIEAGNFDDGIEGDEYAIGWRDSGNTHYVQVWKAASRQPDGKPSGRDWTVHIDARTITRVDDDDARQYSRAASGQIDGEGAEELVLVDEDSSETSFDAFRTDADMERVDGKSSDSDIYKQTAVGQIIEGGTEEVAVILSVDRADKTSLIVYEFDEDDGELASDEDWEWAFAPQPEYVFLADIFGNGDEEVFILRNFPEGEDGPRLIMRDDWGDDRERFDEDDPLELDLDDDNGFQAGVGADVDADGRDEIVIMRDEGDEIGAKIRIYTRPESSLDDDTIDEYEVDNDGETILAGDLDAVGFLEGPQLAVDKALLEESVPTGTRSDPVSVTVTNNATTDPVTFNISKPGNTPWLELSNSVMTTPATFNVTFDATNLTAGEYNSTITLQAQTPNVVNPTILIDVELTVEPAALVAQPSTASFIHFPCSEPLQPVTTTLDVRVEGTNGLSYRAAILGVPEGASAASINAAGGQISGGEVDATGKIVLYDHAGNARVLPAPSEVSASAALTTAWYVDPAVTWITGASSDTTETPSNLTITISPTVLGPNFALHQAVMVLVADTQAGNPPENVEIVPVIAMCARGRLGMPSISVQ
jgi:hypothetical protein